MSKQELLDMIIYADLDEAELKALKIIVGAMVSKNKGRQPIETVTVLDLPAASLLAIVKEKAGLTFINPGYERYGFVRDERGKTYEVAEWAPNRRVSSKTVCEHFRTIGGSRPFMGNPGAFLAWVMRKDRLAGWYASIPDDDQCFSDDGKLYAPYFRRVDSHRRLCLDKVADSWHDEFVFLAFREIPQK